MTIRVTAPGKIIVMGEHAAVYGRPALVAAIDRRLRVRLETEAGAPGLRLVLPALGVDELWSWADLLDYAEARRGAWRSWLEHGRVRPFTDVLGGRPAHLVATSVGEVLRQADRLPACGAVLRIDSEIPVGSGFGSSAAAASAVIVAMLALLELKADPQRVENLVLEAERRQHGAPSGVDGAAVVRGGVVWAERRPEGLWVQPVATREAVLEGFGVAHSGMPPESTGEVVAAVARRRDREPEAFDAGLDQAAEATRDLCASLGTKGAASEILRCWRLFAAWLASIGVVPEPVRQLIEQIEQAGGAAKISGAGSLAGPGAGSFLVYHPEPSTTDRLIRLGGLEPLRLRLGGGGVRREK